MGREASDLWARWLRHSRHGGDPEERRRVHEALAPVRDRILENARIATGETVLDAGTGEGLVGFGALPLVGAEGRVIFSDVSEELLEQCRSLAEELGVLPRCSFVRVAAEDLWEVPSSSVDAVTVRSVLIYVREKRKALAEFHRVLRSGGRLSVFEPINRFEFPGSGSIFFGYDVAEVADLARKVAEAYRGDDSPEQHPMLDFDERDLLRLAHDVGFEEVHVELNVDMIPPASGVGRTWGSILHFAPNPQAPTLEEAIRDALDTEEAARFRDHLRRQVEGTTAAVRCAVAYLWAVKRPATEPEATSSRRPRPGMERNGRR
ncbi:MAG: class I SAM-dependent methyltransferase [Planctomycetota bacterium]|jgi:ubiquinone/menaquinone biosynthesis C-methylase UbiE